MPCIPSRRLLLTGCALLALALAVPARAEVPLAEPGECAQADPNASLVRPVVYAPGGPVVGDPVLLLGAAVAASPAGALVPSPHALGFPGTGACDNPGSGCMGPIVPGPTRPTGVTTTSSGPGPTIRESPGQPKPPPGLP